MGICWGNDLDIDVITTKYQTIVPKQINTIKYIKPEPSTLEEQNINERIEYIVNGLKQDLFPTNYRRNGERWSWGVAIDIPSNTSFNPDVFAFDKMLYDDIKYTINYSKSLNGDYGDSSAPQIIINYSDDCFTLKIECYKRNAELYRYHKYLLNEDAIYVFLSIIIKEGLVFYDLSGNPAKYDPDKYAPVK